jgi:hypothetical protein
MNNTYTHNTHPLLLFSDAVLVWLVVIATTSIMVLLLLLWWRLLLLLLRWRLRQRRLPFCIVDQGNQQQRHVQLHVF